MGYVVVQLLQQKKLPQNIEIPLSSGGISYKR